MLFIVGVVLIAINIPIYIKIFKIFFKDKTSFERALRYAFRPNVISLFKGDLDKDIAHVFTLGIAILLCLLLTAIEIYVTVSVLKLIGMN